MTKYNIYEDESENILTGKLSEEEELISKISDDDEETVLVGYVMPTGQISGALYDTELEIKVDITESGPRGVAGDGESSGTMNYLELDNIPSIEQIKLKGNKSFKDLGLDSIFKKDIDRLF